MTSGLGRVGPFHFCASRGDAKFRLLAVFLIILPAVSAAQEHKRRFAKYQFFYCAGVHVKLAEAYRKTGFSDAEAFHTSEANFLYEKGKNGLIEIGKSPDAAAERVKKHRDGLDSELQSTPSKIQIMLHLCNSFFPERASRPRNRA